MSKHDITSRDSPVVVYVSDQEVYLHPCSRGDHLWEQNDPGLPLECIVCGALYPTERKSKEQLREEIYGRIKDGLRSPEYGYA